MLKRLLIIGLLGGLAGGILASCGGSSTTFTAPGKGTLFTFISDTPLCDILSSRLTITGLTVTPQGGGGPVSIIPSSSSIRLGLGDLMDSSTILSLNTVQEGTYNQATFTLSVLQLGVYDPILSPPTTTVGATLTPSTPTFNLDPPLTITTGQVSALQIDYDLASSVQLTPGANGSFTASATSVFHGSGLTAEPVTGFGELDDLMGFVRSVNTSSTNPTFIGSFLMQFLSSSLPSGPAVNVSYTKDTVMYGAPALNQLLTESVVEVDAYVDANGNLVAKTVEVEDQEDVSDNKAALIGLVTSLTKDSNNNLTGFGLWVRDEEPDASVTVAIDSIVEVNVSSTTTYQFSSRSANFANLTFDPTALAVGQEVVVHGPFTPVGAGKQPVIVAAEKVYLKLQTVQGSLGSLLQVGSDNKTGAFQLNPCCTLLQGAPIYVLTNNQTNFVNVPGLSELGAQSSLLIKGLPFFQPLGGNINGVSVPPGTLVLLAKQVHRLP